MSGIDRNENGDIIDTPSNVKLLNEKLGITEKENLFNSAGVKSINEMLEKSKSDFELLCKEISESKKCVENAEKVAEESYGTIMDAAKGDDINTADLKTASDAIGEFTYTIETMLELIGKGNDIIEKLYDAIVNTDIIDPDLVNATATVIHSIRESNDNLIQFNSQKMALEQQYRLAIESEKLKQKHRLELEFFKWNLRQRELENKARIKREEEAAKSKADEPTENDDGSCSWSQSAMAEMVRRMEQKN